MRPLLANRFASARAADWLAALDVAEVPSGPVNDVAQAFAQPQAQARAMDQVVAHPRLGDIRQIGVPYNLSATPATIRSAPPLLGEHSEEILGELDYELEEIARMRSEGVI